MVWRIIVGAIRGWNDSMGWYKGMDGSYITLASFWKIKEKYISDQSSWHSKLGNEYHKGTIYFAIRLQLYDIEWTNFVTKKVQRQSD